MTRYTPPPADASLRDYWPDEDAPPPPAKPWPYHYDPDPSRRPFSFVFWPLYLVIMVGYRASALLRLPPPHTLYSTLLRVVWCVLLVLMLVLAEAMWSRRTWRTRAGYAVMYAFMALMAVVATSGHFSYGSSYLPGWRRDLLVLVPFPLIFVSLARNSRYRRVRD